MSDYTYFERKEAIRDKSGQLWRVTVSMTHDYDCLPTDSECYDEKQIEAFNSGEWSYVGLCFDAEKAVDNNAAGIVKYDEVAADSLWGIDFGFGAPNAERDHILETFKEISGWTPEVPADIVALARELFAAEFDKF